MTSPPSSPPGSYKARIPALAKPFSELGGASITAPTSAEKANAPKSSDKEPDVVSTADEELGGKAKSSDASIPSTKLDDEDPDSVSSPSQDYDMAFPASPKSKSEEEFIPRRADIVHKSPTTAAEDIREVPTTEPVAKLKYAEEIEEDWKTLTRKEKKEFKRWKARRALANREERIETAKEKVRDIDHTDDVALAKLVIDLPDTIDTVFDYVAKAYSDENSKPHSAERKVYLAEMLKFINPNDVEALKMFARAHPDGLRMAFDHFAKAPVHED